MNTYLIYGIILVILLILELLYFTIADKFDIIDMLKKMLFLWC